MLHHFFTHFGRNFLNSWFLNLINLMGLSMAGIAAVLVFLYVDHETSFDSFHQSSDRLFRFEAQTNSDQWFSNLGMEHAKEMRNGTFPEIEDMVQFNVSGRSFVESNAGKFAEKNVAQTPVNSRFFKVFNFQFLEGSSELALNKPQQVVLSSSTANKYFGEEQALGQTITYDSLSYEVVGVIEDLPSHTHFNFDLIFSNTSLYEREHFHTHTYLKLYPNTDKKALEKKIQILDVAYNEYHILSAVRLIDVENIHLYSDVSFGAAGKGDWLQIRIFQVLALLILAVAIINYVNLSFAIFLNKGKEIGMRKILGESRTEIIVQLSCQAILTVGLAIPVIAMGLFLILPYFEELMEMKLANLLFQDEWYFVTGVLLMIGIGLSTVIYPLIAIGKLDISEMLKSRQLLTGHGGVRYRNALMFIQFVFLFMLGISAWFMNRQINFLDEKDKGFDPTGVLKIGNAYEIGSFQDYERFKNRLLTYPQIEGVAFGPMMGDGMNPLSYKPEGSDEIYENLLSYGVDIDYFDVMQIPILEGEFKTVLAAAENGQIVSLVNQSFIDRYGWGDDPIGKKIILRPGTENELHRKVSAVFKDFHFFSFKEKIAPQIISLRPDPQFVNTNILIRITGQDYAVARRIIEEEWNSVQPALPLSISPMEDAVRKMYVKERQTATVGVNLSLLAIGLSVMGVLGFMFYLISIKSREIVIRKILGASLSQIIRLLNSQLFYSVLGAGLIGSATSYWLLNLWLEEYAYRIIIAPIVFLFAILLAYLIIIGITTLQTIQSTMVNPAVVLKEE